MWRLFKRRIEGGCDLAVHEEHLRRKDVPVVPTSALPLEINFLLRRRVAGQWFCCRTVASPRLN